MNLQDSEDDADYYAIENVSIQKKVHGKVAEKLEIPFKTIVKVVEPA